MRHTQRPYLKRFARIHFWAVFFSFTTYLSFGFALGPDFFKQDVMKRISALADDIITVTAVVLGPPAQPVVTATPVCVAGSPHINLDWANDAATDTWDIERDSLPLSTGVIVSQYADTAVVPNAAYTYIVTAYGPMSPGSAVSVPVSATALDCPNLLPPATVTIETVGGRQVATDRTGVSMDRTRPQITGTTNIPFAIVDISLTGPSISARITTNANGYFSWVPPTRLDNGTHTLAVTVTDPSDGARTATDTLSFRTKDGDSNDGSGVPAVSEPSTPAAGEPSSAAAMDFTVSVNSGAEFVFQGDALHIAVTSVRGTFPKGTILYGFILDASGKEIRGLGQPADASSLRTVLMERKAPLSLDPAAYRLRIDAVRDGRIVSREVPLVIRAWPLIRFGEHAEVTYFEVASLLGTIFFLLLSLLILFMLLFVREYWLYMHHIRHVTERNLEKMGFISPKRKGVAK